MIPEKMQELLILSGIVKKWNGKRAKRKKYNMNAIINRMQELQEEFLEPYVIDSTSKE